MTDNILDQQDEIKDYLVLMPENQRDPQALAKKAYHADTHIKMLEAANDELRRDYLKERETNQTRAKLEDVLKQLESKQQLTSSEQSSGERSQEKPTIDLDEIDKRMSSKIVEYETAKKQQENANLVRSKLKERFGDNYSTAVKQHLDTLELSEEDFNAMARKSPAALFRTLGLDEVRRDTFQAPPRGNISFNPKPETNKPWSYWKNYNKEHPGAFKDPKVTNEMTAAAIQLGDAFYDSDFGKYGDAVQ